MHAAQSWACVQGLVMLLCVAAFDWPAEAAKAVAGACGLRHSAEDAPAVQPLLCSDAGTEEDPGAASAHAHGTSDALSSTRTTSSQGLA